MCKIMIFPGFNALWYFHYPSDSTGVADVLQNMILVVQLSVSFRNSSQECQEFPKSADGPGLPGATYIQRYAIIIEHFLRR